MADPITLAAVGSAMSAPAAVAAATPFTMGAMGAAGAAGAAGATTAAMGAGAGALGTMGAIGANPLITAGTNAALAGNSLLGAAGNAAAGQAATIIPTQAFPAALSSANPAFVGPQTFMGPQAPTFMQSAINTGQNIQGLMSENPALTSVAKQAAGGMMQPPPPPQVLQAPPIQSGQFAPVDFMSLLSQKPPQMQRRTSLLG
jgi:hypothetical protein